MAEDCKFEVVREAGESVLHVDCSTCSYCPSIEDNPLCMQKTIEQLAAAGTVTKIIFSQRKDYEYDYSLVEMLSEIASLFNNLADRQDLFSHFAVSGVDTSVYHRMYVELQTIIFGLLKRDPVGAYVELKRLLRREKINLEKASGKDKEMVNNYVRVLLFVIKEIEKTKLIQAAQHYLAGFKLGDRNVYREIFKPVIKPDFMYTKLMASYPADAEELASYTLGRDTEISIFKIPDSIQYLYHMMPPEFKLPEEKYLLLDVARNVMAEHKPTREEFTDPQRMREVFQHVGSDLLRELATYRQMRVSRRDIEQLSQILIRYTVGFGLVEVLLQDEQIQDVSINSPLGRIPMFIVHGEFADCYTNIVPTVEEAESWASKLRLISGRPLDEANPILDTELTLPGARTRVSAITEPLDPSGIAFSFRRHRARPWTLPLFMKYRSINALMAGLWSFVIDGNKTMLIVGTRSSGKSSLLGSLLVEMMRRYRIITIEDTLELPVDPLRELGYNIQQMKVATYGREGTELTAADGIRATLRLGDSALIVGEVRSKEALALYEAMRIGAAANVVAGTLHADSPYGLFDRVVNDLGVPRTSFKATDAVIVANPVRSPDGLHRWRRVISLTEVRKHWEDDPVAEGGFVDLLKYDPKKDELLPTADLINGDSDLLKAIAGNVKEWAGNWDAVWDNVMLRAKIKQTILDTSQKLKDYEILEAPFVVMANDEFHNASEQVKEEVGALDSKMIFERWNNWLQRAIRKRQLERK